MDIILVGYNHADTLSAIKFCEHGFASFGGRRILVLNRSQLREGIASHVSSWEVVIGSNAMSEFSGWQEGLASTRSPPIDTMFVNDTVVRHRLFSFARRCALTSAIRSANTPSLIGFTDRIDGNLSIAGLPLVEWVSTYCYVLTGEALARLGGSLYEAARVVACVPGGVAEDAFFSGLSQPLEAHLRRWLFAGGWHGASRLTSDNADRLERKARTIVAEMLLSARCNAAGITLVDPFRASPIAHQADRILRAFFGLFDPTAKRGV